MATLKTGGEVDAYCTKCRMTLAHTILAMVGATQIARVQCNTCHGQHTYRTEDGSKPRPTAARAPQPRKEVISWDRRVAELDPAKARTYAPKQTFAVDELISHPTFGLGIVSAVRQDKIDVAFKAFEKTLVHARGEGSGVRPAYAPPVAREAGPADKPLSPDPTGPAAKPIHPHPDPLPPAGEGEPLPES
jgi:hypothetical protein